MYTVHVYHVRFRKWCSIVSPFQTCPGPKMAVLGCVAPESPCHWSGGRLACFTARFDDITGEEKPTGGLINQQVVNLHNLPLKTLMVKKPPFWLMIIEASWGFHWFHFHQILNHQKTGGDREIIDEPW